MSSKSSYMFARNRLKIQITHRFVVLSLLIILPSSLWFLVISLSDSGEIEYRKLNNDVSEIQQMIKDIDNIDDLNNQPVSSLVQKGDRLIITNTTTGEVRDFSSKEEPVNDISAVETAFAPLILKVIVKYNTGDMKGLSNLSMEYPSSEGIFAVVNEEVTCDTGDFYEIEMGRNTTHMAVVEPLRLFLRTFPFGILWIVLVFSISTWAHLSYASKKLISKMDSVFDELAANQYRGKIPNKIHYGKEISSVIERMNQLLERMRHIVQSNAEDIEDVNHEINTKLTAIKQSADIIRMFGLENKEFVEENLNAIDENIEYITNTAAAIRNISKLNASDITNKELYKLHDLLDTYILNKEKTYPDFNFIIEYDSEEPELYINKEHFYLALNPIVENAVAYSNEGAPIITVRVKNEQCTENLSISITNFGPPIAEEDMACLFDRRYRGKNVSHAKSGSGLGLSISKKAMDLYGGEITVSCRITKVTFTLIFPKHTNKPTDLR